MHMRVFVEISLHMYRIEPILLFVKLPIDGMPLGMPNIFVQSQ